MSSATFELIAARNLETILPLDEQARLDIVHYAASLPSASEAAAHLRGILGEDPLSLDYIHEFCSQRWPSKAPIAKAKPRAPLGGSKKGQSKPAQNRAVTPADIGRGYMKKEEEESYFSASKKPKPHISEPASASTNVSTNSEILGREKPQSGKKTVTGSSQSLLSPPRSGVSTPHLTPYNDPGQQANAYDVNKQGVSSRHSVESTKPTLVPLKKQVGTLSSDLLEPKKKSSSKSAVTSVLAKRNAQNSIKVQSLQEVDGALRLLEQCNTTGERRVCNCQAQRHPILEIAPNCLNCGKIICVREGLGPCTFCNTPLLEKDEYEKIVLELRQERGQLKTEIHNEQQSRKPTAGGSSLQTYSGSAGGQRTSAHLPVLAGLDQANAQLSNLLAFQADSAQRTKIIDNASDFELPGQGTDKWATATERAAQLRKQERTLRMNQAMERQRNGRGRQVVSIDLKGNRTVISQHSELDYSSEEEEAADIDIADAVKEQTGWKPRKWNPDKDDDIFIKPSYPASHLSPESNLKSENGAHQQSSQNATISITASVVDESAPVLLTPITKLPVGAQNYIKAIDGSQPSHVQEDLEIDNATKDLENIEEHGNVIGDVKNQSSRKGGLTVESFTTFFKDTSSIIGLSNSEPVGHDQDGKGNRSRKSAKGSSSVKQSKRAQAATVATQTTRKGLSDGSGLDGENDSDTDPEASLEIYNRRLSKNSASLVKSHLRPLESSVSSARESDNDDYLDVGGVPVVDNDGDVFEDLAEGMVNGVLGSNK